MMSDSSLTPMLLTNRQAAAALQVSERTLYTLRTQQGLPYVMLGKCIRFRPADVDRWLAERATEGTDEPRGLSKADAAV